MENIKSKTQQLKDHVADYASTYLQYSVVNATDKAAGAAAGGVTAIALTILGFFILLFLSMGLGFWIGQALDNVYAGFFIVAGFYLLIAVLLLALQKKVIAPFIKNKVIQMVYE
jgi:hypothetical protein